MKRVLAWLLIFVLAFSMFSVLTTAVDSPEEDTDVETEDGPLSPRTGLGGNVVLIAVCCAAFMGAALVALKKVRA